MRNSGADDSTFNISNRSVVCEISSTFVWTVKAISSGKSGFGSGDVGQWLSGRAFRISLMPCCKYIRSCDISVVMR